MASVGEVAPAIYRSGTSAVFAGALGVCHWQLMGTATMTQSEPTTTEKRVQETWRLRSELEAVGITRDMIEASEFEYLLQARLKAISEGREVTKIELPESTDGQG